MGYYSPGEMIRDGKDEVDEHIGVPRQARGLRTGSASRESRINGWSTERCGEQTTSSQPAGERAGTAIEDGRTGGHKEIRGLLLVVAHRMERRMAGQRWTGGGDEEEERR
ncbi:hypothetical protein ACRE_065700 [Hapsidospora chrysogenum ATCC 11550]|uniref:Uncharacterized protein n=1 Tax=Hapsidospora chrysogenum (strain ATCC 11550 / CBS 779.69 / DSM 880 / IAM 14645 / JCM 23072 / IMI 49137) TaxID=857340 RepID=A0A086T021_HAPC1|nr:hypothetical protein ACRE_065700 [Hapsidospora chrysogenum ATCC 11550]